MAKGRTVKKFVRAYVDGYDMSGYTVDVGSLNYGYDQNDIIALSDAVMGALPGQGNIGIGNINGIMDNTATVGMHVNFNSSDAVRDVMIPIGIRAVPAAGDPSFTAQVNQNTYQADVTDGVLTATLGLGEWDYRGDSVAYPYAWGTLIHDKAARTAVNTSSGHDNAVVSNLGGYMMYQLFAGSTGTVTIKVEDSTGGAWADVPGLTSGVLTEAGTVASALVPTTLATTQVDRYVRWQIVLGTATSATFALAFVRGR